MSLYYHASNISTKYKWKTRRKVGAGLRTGTEAELFEFQ
jgi:hypothetical protein